MTVVRLSCAVICFATVMSWAVAQDTRAAKPSIAVMNNIERPLRSLPQLSQDADAVVLSTVTAVEEVHPTADSVRTRCTVKIIKTYKPLRGLGLLDGTLLVVDREGGRLLTGAATFNIFEAGFPMFKVGESYLLFLCAKPQSPLYEVCSGPQGTWRLNEDLIKPLNPSHVIGSEPRPIIAVTSVVQKTYYSAVAGSLSAADIAAMLEGELDQNQIADFVRQKGVNFPLTLETQRNLTDRGARPELVQAISENRK